MNIEMSVLQGIMSTKIPIAPTRGELDRMVRKVQNANAEKQVDFAFIVGRNWVISKARKATCEQNRLMEIAIEKQRVKEERAAFNVVKRQARRLIMWLSPDIKPTQREQLQLVWWRVFEKKSAEEVAALLPGTNRDARIKRYQRGRNLLLKHAPSPLAEYLSYRVSINGGLTETKLA